MVQGEFNRSLLNIVYISVEIMQLNFIFPIMFDIIIIMHIFLSILENLWLMAIRFSIQWVDDKIMIYDDIECSVLMLS